jgi:DNA ligase (NAD+)
MSLDLKIKDKAFNNILNNINVSKNNSLEKLIFGLGIRHIGETTAKVLAKTFRNIDNLMNAKLEELLIINDIGETVAVSIIDYFENHFNQQLIADLKALGVNTKYISAIRTGTVDKDGPYFQKSFVITGTFSIPRHEIKRYLENKYDANVSDSISKSTDYLLAGAEAGSKLIKAQKLNIKIITDEI